MPTKGIEENKLYFMVDGELRPFAEIKGIENIGIDGEEEIETSEFQNTKRHSIYQENR